MEYNSIEEQLKQKLNQRTITPSENAWSRIKGRQRVKRKKPVKWMVAAAVIAVAVGIFQQIPSDQPTEIITVKESPIKESPISIEQTPDIPAIEKPTIVRRRSVAVTLPKPIEARPTAVGVVSITMPVDTSGNLAIDEKITPVDYSSAESLLEAAQQELAGNRIEVESSTRTAELLQEAENDVNETFKEKVFDLFKNKFKTIKIALKDE